MKNDVLADRFIFVMTDPRPFNCRSLLANWRPIAISFQIRPASQKFVGSLLILRFYLRRIVFLSRGFAARCRGRFGFYLYPYLLRLSSPHLTVFAGLGAGCADPVLHDRLLNHMPPYGNEAHVRLIIPLRI